MPAIVLASTSPYRRALLERLGLAFEVQAPRVQEILAPGEPPEHAVLRLAEAKARAVARTCDRALVIGSDQLAVLDGEALGKPGTARAAVAQLQRACASAVEFVTGVVLVDASSGIARRRLARNRVRFRPLARAQLEAYVARDNPIDCAGGFKSEGLGIALFEAIEGPDPTALVGLPLIALCDLLAEAGVDVLQPGDLAQASVPR